MTIQHYAAMDVLLTWLLAEKMLSLTSDSDFTVHGTPGDLQGGSVVKVWCGAGHHCALKGTVKFLGTEKRTTESRYWGDKYVGKGRAIVTVEEFFVSNVKPPFSFVYKTSPSDSWSKEATIGSLFQQNAELKKEMELMVQTCNLYILVHGARFLDRTPPSDEELKAARAARKKDSLDSIRLCSWNPLCPNLVRQCGGGGKQSHANFMGLMVP